MSLTASRVPSEAGGVSVMKTPGGLLVGIGLALPRPAAGQVMPADRAVAVDRESRDAEDHPLHRGGGEQATPADVLRRGLRRLLVIDLRPHEVEEPLADQAGQEAQDEADRLVEQLHRDRRLPEVEAGRRVFRHQVGKHWVAQRTMIRAGEAGIWTTIPPKSCS